MNHDKLKKKNKELPSNCMKQGHARWIHRVQ